MSSDSEQESKIIYKLLTDRSVPSKEEYLVGEGASFEAIHQLYDEVFAIRETLQSFSKGDFDVPITGRGVVWGHLKALQANLKHLAWQVEQVAEGDLSQRVDFMGSFSTSFNKMVLQLEDSLEKMKEREASERTQIMLDATPLACSFWNEQLEILDCNLEAVKLFDLGSKQEYLARFFDLAPKYQPDGRLSSEAIREKLCEAFEKGHARAEFVRQKLNGEPIPTEMNLVRVQQKDQRIVAGYSRDLRELKQKQAALDQQRLLLLDVINSSPICFVILVDGKIKFISVFAKHFLGLDSDEPFIDCFVDQEKGAALLAEVKKDIRIEWEPVTIHSQEHGTKEMLANLFLTEYFGEQGVIVWLVDITELKKVEADLRAAKETAEHLGRVKDEFIANMSHELRTPMNSVLGIIHLLHHTDLSKEQTSYVGTMEESAKSLLQIINDILDFSNIDSGKVFIKSEKLELLQTLANVWQTFRDAAEAKKLSLSYAIDDDVPDTVMGDSTRLRQVLVSLTDNAIKFTAQGSVRIRVQLESSEKEKVVLRFSVQDTGIGLKAEDREGLFQAFSQADTSGTRKYGGVGLGLAMAKSLVEMMNGRIWCESEVQQGTVFFFTAVFGLPKDENETIVFSESFWGQPILLVEDNKINQIVATKMLQEKGFLVDVAPNGLRAVEMVNQRNYVLVLMDIQMPEMDGIQATQAIRSDAKYKSLPIVALTANAMEDDRQRCLEAGMNDHLAKPIDPELLYRAILKWAKTSQANDI
jgi:signal transduction histidine kinase/CheY-like chemotaxis protein